MFGADTLLWGIVPNLCKPNQRSFPDRKEREPIGIESFAMLCLLILPVPAQG